MLEALFILLGCQLLGEVLAGALALPVPGPVIGMVVLFMALAYRGRVGDNLAGLSTALLAHLSLLFVPAGVGIMRHGGRVADDWPALTITLVVSTVLTLAVTAAVMQWLMRRWG
jgi:holin-like protein